MPQIICRNYGGREFGTLESVDRCGFGIEFHFTEVGMRGILLSLASFVVGSATAVAVVGVGSAGAEAIFAAGVVWAFALAVGVLLSAPFFLNPPDFVGGWSMTLPLPLWVVVFVFKAVSWVGLMILRAAWAVIGLAVSGVRDSIGHGAR